MDARWQAEALRRDYVAAMAVHARALALYASGQHFQAQPLLERVLRVGRSVLGADHPDTPAWYDNLARTLLAKGR